MTNFRCKSMPSAFLLLVATLVGGGYASSVQGAVVKVTGIFEPSAFDPGNSSFKNTTPRSQFCSWRPAECDRKNSYVFSVPATFTKSGEASPDARRDSTYIRFPAARNVVFSNPDGRTFSAEVIFTSFTTRLDFTNGRDPLYYDVSGGCTSIKGAGGTGWSMGGWALKTPERPSACYSTQTRNGRNYRYRNFGLGIDVKLPSAVSLSSGVYTAREVYLIGNGSNDLDLGDGISGDSEVVFNFEFEVKHSFKVEFPGDIRVSLAPLGGWTQWIDYGRAPSRLQQELPFTLTSSSDFSVKLRCEHEVSERCGIEDLAAGTIVPVDVNVTMPGMRVIGTGAPAINTSLASDASGTVAPRFTPDTYLVSRPSKLEFSANGTSVTEMLKAPGSRWQGDVTVVFDSDP